MAEKSETKQYSLAEVKEHNDGKSSWIVIHNNIYDVTAFLNEHPGGEEVLLEQAGRDGSEAFEDVGHSSDARELMKRYKIGEIIESERKFIPEKPTSQWTSDSSESSNSNWTSWLIPVSLGIFATIAYRFYFFASQSSSNN